jgi:hypothetical protein
MLWLDRQVLTRHCCQGQGVEEIAAALSLTPDEVRRLHDRATTRLSLALLRLLIDLEVEAPTSLLAGAGAEEGEAGPRPNPPHHTNGRDALAA